MGRVDNDSEIVRVRERVHKLFSSVRALELRVQRLEHLGEENNRLLNEIAPTVRQMSRADEIAAAVTDALDKRGPALPIHWAWKAIIGLSVVVALAGGLKGLVA